MHNYRILQTCFVVLALAQMPTVSVASAREPDHGPVPALPTVVSVAGTRVVVAGRGVEAFVPRMPIVCFEAENGRMGLQLFEATVLSVLHQTSALEVVEGQGDRVKNGALCEPRFAAEARAYRAALTKPQADGSRPAGEPTISHSPEPPRPRVKHRPPHSVQYGKPIWIEAVLTGPADKLFCYWRMGEFGAFVEVAMDPKGDGLYTATLVLSQSDPPPRVIQYYLIAQGTAGRTAVHADPADPRSVALDSVPESTHDQLVAHGPVERATHRKPLEISAEINKRFARPMLYYRARGAGTYLSVAMTPAGAEQFRAAIPARDVVAPGLAYYIAVMDEKGIVRDGFASSRNPQTVTVIQPQILSAESNRNRLSFNYVRANHGASNDQWQHFDLGLERLFFGFLVARLSAAAWIGESPSGIKTPATTTTVDPVGAPAQVPSTLPIYMGRAGLDVNIGDYVGISADLDMGTFKSGAGLGYRGSARIGDEHVASIDIGVEQIWDIDVGNLVFDIKKGTLRIPFGDDWRIMAVAAQERILTDAPKAIRLTAGVEVDLGASFAVALNAGVAGRKDQLGLSLNSGLALRF